MAKINNIFKIDASLIPVFIILIITGVGIHLSHVRSNHHSWIVWSAFHVVSAIAFLILVYFHVRQHIGWVRTLLKGNTKGRGVTVVLSAIMIAATLSGIVLLAFVDGEGSGCGHFHWIMGIILGVIGTGHYVKRFSRLRKGLKPRDAFSRQ